MKTESITQQVSLVAGPECGTKINWPNGESRIQMENRFGHAIYERESETTAIYIAPNEFTPAPFTSLY